jgi:pyrimidine deaminase RibD-like protein
MADSEDQSNTLEKHKHYMQLAINEAKKSPPKPTNFRVGAVLVDETNNTILATGYTLELPGNTHAEQCCFQKIARAYDIPEENIGDVLTEQTVLYTTMEPCSTRLSGNLPCVERILRTRQGRNTGIKTVYVGVFEPQKFVGHNTGKQKLEDGGIDFVHVPGFESEILTIATKGHDSK